LGEGGDDDVHECAEWSLATKCPGCEQSLTSTRTFEQINRDNDAVNAERPTHDDHVDALDNTSPEGQKARHRLLQLVEKSLNKFLVINKLRGPYATITCGTGPLPMHSADRVAPPELYGQRICVAGPDGGLVLPSTSITARKRSKPEQKRECFVFPPSGANGQQRRRTIIAAEEFRNERFGDVKRGGNACGHCFAWCGKAYRQKGQTQEERDTARDHRSGELNCCPSACGPNTAFGNGEDWSRRFGGYPVMWDKNATVVPAERSDVLKEGPRELQYDLMCEVPKDLARDEHIIRVAPCLLEQWPFCARIKITKRKADAAGNSSSPLVVGWATLIPARRNIAGCRTPLKARNRGTNGFLGHFDLTQKLFDFCVDQPEKPVCVSKTAYELAHAADALVRKAVADLRFELADETLGTLDKNTLNM